MELEKIEYNEPTVALYTLMFYNSEGEHIESITISIDGWLTCDGYFHYVKSGNLDLDYLEQMVLEKIDSKPIEERGVAQQTAAPAVSGDASASFDVKA